jgi:hypothetical protein
MTTDDRNKPRKPRELLSSEMPLYPTEAQMARAVLGERAKDWKRIAKVLEDKEGFPRISQLMGARFWPAVIAFFYSWQHMSIRRSGEKHSRRCRPPHPRLQPALWGLPQKYSRCPI